jgi:ribonuclease-3
VSEDQARVNALEAAIGYTFSDRRWLTEALMHSSTTGGAEPDNERLEFLGDAVVGLVVGDLLQREWASADEGRLSRRRAGLVNARSLADQARTIDLGDCLTLGRGEEKTGGRDKNSILSDAYEALVGAVYRDGGFPAAFALLEKAFAEAIRAPLGDGGAEAKTHLQELTQRVFQETPSYELLRAHGPDHAKEFEVTVLVEGKVLGHGQGSSKKGAEQAAARQALTELARQTIGEEK